MQDEIKGEDKKDVHFMNEALKEAQKAMDFDEVPIGAVIVCDGQIVGRGYNYVEHLNDVTAHAEMQAITAAANKIGAKYLDQCDMYVTLEPCPMCAGALFHARVKRLIYGTGDPKNGYSLVKPGLLHPKTKVTHGILEQECANLMISFFAKKRT